MTVRCHHCRKEQPLDEAIKLDWQMICADGVYRRDWIYCNECFPDMFEFGIVRRTAKVHRFFIVSFRPVAEAL